MPEHTAVIYFHGIGDPQRHVSLSTFLDYFDRFGMTRDSLTEGKPRNFKYRTMISSNGELLNFIELKKIRYRDDKSTRLEKEIKIFEGYWAPESTSRYGAFYMLLWILARLKNPLLFAASKWRRYMGVRLLFLHSLVRSSADKRFAQTLEKLYREFENWEGRGRYPKGRFGDFLEFVEWKRGNRKELVDLAHRWRWSIIRTTIIILTIYATALALLVLMARNVIHATAVTAGSLERLSWPIEWNLIFASLLLIAIASAILSFAVSSRKHLFDVFLWTMETEKDQRFASRRRVLDYARNLIRQVTDDPDCRDCIIVAHSLGSAIATEAILSEGLRAKITRSDTDNLAKIRYVFTVGSPIDRIFYFFQTDRTFSHRYNRLFEEQRLSIALPPFTRFGKQPTTRIVNFWSRYDPISSPVLSLRKSISERRSALTDIEVLTPGFPYPAKTHTTYFADPNVMEPIYNAVMSGKIAENSSVPENSRCLWCDAGAAALAIILALWLSLGVLENYNSMPYIFALVAEIAFAVAALQFRRRRVLAKYQERHGDFLRR